MRTWLRRAGMVGCLVAGLLLCTQVVRGEAHLVRDGKPLAEIVLAENSPRMTVLAALELQYYLQKISGARLPIVSQPGKDMPVKVYIGRSPYADKLGVVAEGLKYGAFRMVSGPDWLALVGQDHDYALPEGFTFTRSSGERDQAEWDKRTKDVAGPAWEIPFVGIHRKLWSPRDFGDILAARYGADNAPLWKSHEGYWQYDGDGSLNAVYEYLRSLGVRWYMVGPLGEVVPEQKTIALPSLDKTVRPDFPIRTLHITSFATFTFDDMIWLRRLGFNGANEALGFGRYVHGARMVFGHKDMQKAHPEYYALIRGERDTGHRGSGTPCFSSEGFIQETIKYVRVMYDRFDAPHVSIWPGDGFRKCECEACAPKAANELIWGFVDRVARELYKTHPDRLLSSGAYTPYTDAPDTIDKFTPNVVVFIASYGRPGLDDPLLWKIYTERVEGWRSKLAPGRLIRNSNNRFTLIADPAKPCPFPVIHPRAMARDLRYMKGHFLGDWNEVTIDKGKWHAPGLNHLTLYTQSRFLWDAEQDVEALLEDYYTRFYGPAAAEAKAALEYAQANYNRQQRDTNTLDVAVRLRFVEMLHTARRAAGDTVYGKRIQLMLDELTPLETLQKELKVQQEKGGARANAPLAIGYDMAHEKKLKTYPLQPLPARVKKRDAAADAVAKAPPAPKKSDIETTFRVAWEKNMLYVDIRCEEPDMENLFVSDDVWGGDCVGIVIETQNHSYYQIEINPAGKVYDADRSAGRSERWLSHAKVTPHRGENYWRVEVRLPVVGVEDGAMDPLHNIVGSKPTAERPWFFNIGRSRIRGGAKTAYAFTRTGTPSWHVLEKFGRLIIEDPR